MLALLLLAPLALLIPMAVTRNARVCAVTMLVHALLNAGLSVALALSPGASLGRYFEVDPTAALFLALLSVVYLFVVLGSLAFFRLDHLSARFALRYSLTMMLFVYSMNGVILSAHLGLLWVFVELTTLASAPFIYFEKRKTSLEATWKYIFICSVGIALSFIGIIFFSMACSGSCSLFFRDLPQEASALSPLWLKFSFPFILVGFGTKVGLAPMHAWLPDAHSEAPAPASALLSGMLLNTAFLGILRICMVLSDLGLDHYWRPLLAATGFISLFIAAVYTTRITNFKRMLAYSSIENMGIIAIALSLGGLGAFASMLHMVGHSLLKTGLFLTSGVIVALYGSKTIYDVRGLITRSPAIGWLWLLLFAGIAAIPPSPLFFTEFMVVRQLLAEGSFVQLAAFVILVSIVVYGMGKTVLGMVFGPETHFEDAAQPVHKPFEGPLPALAIWPQVVILVLAVALALWMPSQVQDLLNGAVQ